MNKKELIRLMVKCTKEVIEIIEDITNTQQNQNKRLKKLEKEIEEIKNNYRIDYDVNNIKIGLNNSD
jgi:hypothetical protein